MLPDWQLPPGTDRGLWDYVQSERVATEYDQALAGSALLEADLRFAEKHFTPPGRLVDLGCGTGRFIMHMAPRGFECVAVDLSANMLEQVRAKAERAVLRVECVQANLVELDALPTASFDGAVCLFSTLGMIRGATYRLQFLRHVRRILKPGGTFVLHAHNARYRCGWGLGRKGPEAGDHTMPQIRGGADLTLHHFTARELRHALEEAQFTVAAWNPVGIASKEQLAWPWLLPNLRAYGFLVACR